MKHGVQGLLNRDVIDLSEVINGELDIELLKRTPSSFWVRAAISCQTQANNPKCMNLCSKF